MSRNYQKKSIADLHFINYCRHNIFYLDRFLRVLAPANYAQKNTTGQRLNHMNYTATELRKLGDTFKTRHGHRPLHESFLKLILRFKRVIAMTLLTHR